jgi:hypothetical protein
LLQLRKKGKYSVFGILLHGKDVRLSCISLIVSPCIYSHCPSIHPSTFLHSAIHIIHTYIRIVHPFTYPHCLSIHPYCPSIHPHSLLDHSSLHKIPKTEYLPFFDHTLKKKKRFPNRYKHTMISLIFVGVSIFMDKQSSSTFIARPFITSHCPSIIYWSSSSCPSNQIGHNFIHNVHSFIHPHCLSILINSISPSNLE